MGDEQRDVLTALAQCRNADIDDVEAVIKILAEASVHHEFLQVAMRGGDHAHVDFTGFNTADGPHLVFLQDA